MTISHIQCIAIYSWPTNVYSPAASQIAMQLLGIMYGDPGLLLDWNFSPSASWHANKPKGAQSCMQLLLTDWR